MKLTGSDATAVICATMSSMTPTTASIRDSNSPPIRMTKITQLIEAASRSAGPSQPPPRPRFFSTARQKAPNAPAAPAAEGGKAPV